MKAKKKGAGSGNERFGRWEVCPPAPCYPLAGIKDMLHVEDLFTYCLFSQLRIVFHFQLQKKKKRKKNRQNIFHLVS